ncbi:MAG TPA: histidine kinase [Acidobacteriota bacterium]|nr:histidine kinase [Acidobacteriota bacterium]
MEISSHLSRSTAPNLPPSFIRRPTLVWFAVALILLVGSTGVGAWYYRHQRETFRSRIWEDLNAIADLKVIQISEWRRSRLSEARIIADAMARVPSMDRLIAGDREGGRPAAELLAHFRNHMPARTFAILTPTGQVVWSLPEEAYKIGENDRLAIEHSLRKNDVFFSDFFHEASGAVEMSIFVPLFATAGTHGASGVLMIRLDPDQYLNPLLQAWPTPSQSAETLLVRRQGNSVVFLNEQRHQVGSNQPRLIDTRSEEYRDLPAIRAVLGQEITMEGRDYRRVPVLAATRSVPGSPWALVAKVDQSEGYVVVKQMAKVTGIQVILLILTIFLAVTLLLAQKASEIKSRERQARFEYQELARHSDELQRLAAHLDIREEESRRISREIHEELGNALAGVRFSLLDLQGRILENHPEMAERIQSILTEHKALIEQVRHISQHLRPPILDQLGLIPAIKWLADDFELRTGNPCQVVTEIAGGTNRERPYASAVYRICQEALSNVARHSNATKVRLVFRETELEAFLEIVDNGKGFNLEESNDSSIGIINMRERARCCGGTLAIVTSPGQGTSVTVRIPLPKVSTPGSHEDLVKSS